MFGALIYARVFFPFGLFVCFGRLCGSLELERLDAFWSSLTPSHDTGRDLLKINLADLHCQARFPALYCAVCTAGGGHSSY